MGTSTVVLKIFLDSLSQLQILHGPSLTIVLRNCSSHLYFLFYAFICFLVSQVTTVQLNNNTDRNWGTTALKNDFPNGTLLRTFEQQQEKGKTRMNISIFAQKSVTVLDYVVM